MLLFTDKSSEERAREQGLNSNLSICCTRKDEKNALYYFRLTTWKEFKSESKVPETRGIRMQAGCRGATMVSQTAEI